MLRPDLSMTKVKICEECYEEYKAWIYDSGDCCVKCRQVKALERIADGIETWLGWQ